MVVLSFIVLSAACNGGFESESESPSKDTEVRLVISDPATAPEQLAALIDSVSYRISCPDSALTPYDDAVDIAGKFESTEGSSLAVSALVTDLPLSSCTITLWVFYEDEVICSGGQVISVVDDADSSAPNAVDIVLECSLSVVPPSGDLEIDGSFNLVHGNYCPQLFWLGAYPSPADPAVMNVQTSYIDQDAGCGQNCDPRTCDFTLTPPVCNPAPDPGLLSTLFAPAGIGSFADVNGLETTYACDPLSPGPTEICVLVSDGDNDCDQTRCITIECPDLCEGVACDDGNECTRDRCDPLNGLCSNDTAPNGIACDNCNSTCQAGACDSGTPFTAVQNSNAMTFDGTMQQVDTTLVNPYSGASVPLSGAFNVNISSYKGIGTNDVLTGTNLGDFLLVQDPVGTQRICGVETIFAQNSFDAMILADDFIVFDDMVIEGGNHADLIWANAGNDTLRLNNGADFADGGPGDDIIEGGTGNDTITLWPGSGFDSITGGAGTDQVDIQAIQSQIRISPAANPSYQFDITYLGTTMAQILEVELLVMNDTSIDLATCTGGSGDVCNLCGNDALNGGEECDDGNNATGDGCAADCTAEY